MHGSDAQTTLPRCALGRSFFGIDSPPWPVIVSVLLLLTGCASQHQLVDGDEIPPEIARVPDAVPKVEPLSRSGNPDSYVVFGKRYYPKKNSSGHVERGLASWYGEPFHGRKTSSGEIYDMHAMTAAHKTLPLPTFARVTNLENGRSVVVRVNDRGPFHGPRIIDLSYTAAVKLGVYKTGTAKVEVRAIDPRRRGSDPGPFMADSRSGPSNPTDAMPKSAAKTSAPSRASIASREPEREATQRPASSGRTLYLQIGAFGDQTNAERLRERLSQRIQQGEVSILEPDGDAAAPPLYKVRVGPLASDQDAERISQEIASLGVGTPRRVWN
ncbi:septal ring lytic transglycosylase RlpA family protein [Thiorhodococcus mannitoliphagus]|uniref:Endolytic peptidoglycan transglycosylase RlpA n=1 Tax=Thiorhodococcus mannitoliphagus TaxID=329406 RepID=A0A6P1DU38_9GAMM|nr:septal ring lytic transglycosylase RlpA family protein [Thiorhodococcus mannitoliphagus]NEX20481.1 septal ring lytic transglycosylase RlpA family protein [Thiorhodococcus mannitoliphagus]